MEKIAGQGYLGAIVPREYGGAGLDYITYGLIVEEVGRGCSAMRTVISVQTSLVCSSILKLGHRGAEADTTCRKLCSRRVARLLRPDRARHRLGRREPEDAREEDRRRLVINGAKMWISMGNFAKVALVFAQTDPELEHRGLACFLVDTDQPGFQPQDDPRQDGPARVGHGVDLRSTTSRCPTTRCSARSATASRSRCRALDSGRYSVAAGCVGICQGCVDESVKYAKEREQFGRPIASFQLVQAMIADMVVQTEAARMLVWRAGFLKDRASPNTTETSIAKLYATEAAVACANTAIQVHGGAGYVDDHPVERYFRDVRVTTLYEGTSQIQKLIIGRAATGINALSVSEPAASRDHRRRRRRHDGRRDRPAGLPGGRAHAAARPVERRSTRRREASRANLEKGVARGRWSAGGRRGSGGAAGAAAGRSTTSRRATWSSRRRPRRSRSSTSCSRALAEIVAADCVLATNTSSIPVTGDGRRRHAPRAGRGHALLQPGAGDAPGRGRSRATQSRRGGARTARARARRWASA